MRRVDYIIVGQGIAGSLLAYFLLKRNREILLVDQFDSASSSMVGAGMFNPVTGRRMVKTWMADTLFPFARETYLELERFLDCPLFHPVNLIKLFATPREQEEWSSRIANPELQPYLCHETAVQNFTMPHLATNFGSAELLGTGYVDMALLVHAFRKALLSGNRIIESVLDPNDLSFEKGRVIWNDIRSDRIIFCEGSKAIQNPLFSWLPFVPAKGEVLTIHAEGLRVTKILSQGVFLLPLGENRYRVGSTYRWDDLTDTPTSQGLDELTQKLRQMITCPFTIVEYKAGIRPTVKDRRPILGMHPVRQNAGIFNGLGTKGASIAPFWAHRFVEYLENGIPLEKSVRIERFGDLLK